MEPLPETTGGYIIRGFAQGIGTIAAYALVLWLLSKVESVEGGQPVQAQIVDGYPQLMPSTCSRRVVS